MRNTALLPAPGAILALLVLAEVLPAQILQGRLVEEGTGEPIAGGFVVLHAAEGDASPDATPVDLALTGSNGEFVLRAPRAGPYRVRVDRIGYRSHLAGPFEVGADPDTLRTIPVPIEPIELPVLTAEVDRECEVDPRDSHRLVGIWEEVRKALAAAAWAETRGVFRFTATTYMRIESPGGRLIDHRSRVTEGLQGNSPYASLPAEELARDGYVQVGQDSFDYYAPDAQALLSEPFTRDHCFRLVSGRRIEEPGWIGLAFEPVENRRPPDIEGVMWIDRASSELRRLDFAYTGLPGALARFEPGGRIEFERAPTGAWIVRRWWIRAPSIETHSSVRFIQDSSGLRARGGSQRRTRLTGYIVSGGEVSRVEPMGEDDRHESPSGRSQP